jgi:hypothetical protein
VVDLLHWLAWDGAGWLNAVVNENRYYLPTGTFFEKNTNCDLLALGFYNSGAIRNYSCTLHGTPATSMQNTFFVCIGSNHG